MVEDSNFEFKKDDWFILPTISVSGENSDTLLNGYVGYTQIQQIFQTITQVHFWIYDQQYLEPSQTYRNLELDVSFLCVEVLKDCWRLNSFIFYDNISTFQTLPISKGNDYSYTTASS
ncbi:MAG: hypothetical protein LBJ97_03725 [Mycoplasmataceae bacterium]|nr:hypothetical protein [Mycoplasmataceae bacterium]